MTRHHPHPSLSTAGLLLLAATLALSISPRAAAAQIANADPSTDGATSARVERKGFVIGFGIGASQVKTTADAGVVSASLTQTALSTDFKIGYAPNDRLLIYWSADGAFRSTPEMSNVDGIAYSGLGGIGATYFLDEGEKSFFLSASIGRSSDAVFATDGGTDSVSGSGFAIGGGYEFSGHWLLDADIVLNSVGDQFGGYSQRIVRIGLSWLHY